MTTYTQYICGNNGDALEVSNQATSGFRNPASWLNDWASGGSSNDSGVSVNSYTALTHCPLWQGVNIIAGDLGQVPVRLVRDEFTDMRQHNAWQLLRVRPNAFQTPGVFTETMIQWALLGGNAVAWTPRVGSRVTDVIPLRPDCLWYDVVGYEDEQVVLYHYNSPILGRTLTFFPHDVIHIPGLTWDGIWGYPLWQVAKNTIGFGLALQKHGNKQFSNGARPGGVLEHPSKLNDDARRNLRADWEAVHGGANNAGKIAILWEGMKFNPISMTNIDAQWAEAVDMSAIDAARLLNLPAYKLNYTKDSSTRANLEEQNETYKQMTLTRWANKIDQEYRRKLLTDAEWKSDRFQFVFDWDAFMRADIDTLTQVGDRCVKGEIMNRNEARRLIRLPPYPGGEKFGSPAINPQRQNTPEDGADSPDNGRPRNQVNEAHKKLLFDRILHVCEAENNRVRHAARNVNNFVAWLDDFYMGGKFAAMVESVMEISADAARSVGVSVEYTAALRNHAKKRHAALLEACSVTKAELPDAVEAIINHESQIVAQGLLATALGGF